MYTLFSAAANHKSVSRDPFKVNIVIKRKDDLDNL